MFYPLDQFIPHARSKPATMATLTEVHSTPLGLVLTFDDGSTLVLSITSSRLVRPDFDPGDPDTLQQHIPAFVLHDEKVARTVPDALNVHAHRLARGTGMNRAAMARCLDGVRELRS